MKKRIFFVLALVCSFILIGCNNAKQEQLSTYSFYGTHDYFTISNGSIILLSVFRGTGLGMMAVSPFIML